MTFDTAEQRANASAIGRVSNARAQLVGGPADFPVIFDRAYMETQAGAGAARPVATALDTDIAGVVTDTTQVVIRGITYTVIDLQPDSAGMTLMVLEVA